MKFNDYEYKRPDVEKFKREFTERLNKLKSSTSAEEQMEHINELNELRSDFETMNSIASIKYTLNTADK